jgi:hypothetical protein
MAKKKLSKGQKPAAEPAGAPQGAESGTGATGREMAVPGRNGGTLVQYPPGSNGGVHRGPDLGVRRNIMESLIMRAMIREGTLLVVDATGKKRRHRAKVPMAMAENFVTRLQLIVLKGSDQNVIRLAAVTNDVFKPSKHDKNGSNGGPTPGELPPAPARGAAGRR